MRIVGAEDIHRLLDYSSLAAALREMFRAGCEVPLRHHHTILAPDSNAAPGTLLLMPAWQSGRSLGVKIVTVFPGNARRSLPAVQGTYMLLDAATGVPKALLDGTALTLRRTAAASALAAEFLARPDSAVHLMAGTGALAPHLAAAHAAVRPIRRTLVWGRNPAKAAALAERLVSNGLAAEPVVDLAEAVVAADIVTCATLASEPLICGEWLRPGTHLDLVGGYTPEMREADDEAVRRARVYIDTEAALHEAGDIVQPLRSGVPIRDKIAGDLFALTRGECLGRQTPTEVTLFKSVGSALEDLAAAELAVTRLDKDRRPGGGRDPPLRRPCDGKVDPGRRRDDYFCRCSPRFCADTHIFAMTIAAKICGLSSQEGVAAAVDGGAAYLGFVFYPPSPRAIDPARAAALCAAVPAGVKRVGLFVDADDAAIRAVLDQAPLDILQFHGHESPERVVEAKLRFNRPVIKAIAIAGPEDLLTAIDYEHDADMLLFDAKPPRRPDALPGGNGLAFDWRLIAGHRWPRPWMLSGGLTAELLPEAVTASGASAVDVSSGVERRPGDKDADKIREFLKVAASL